MKGLKKVALVSAIAAASAGAQAELKALDDSMMGELTGQAGLTIDLETEWTIGEFAYHDAGYVLLQNMSMGGNGGGLLDNIRLTIDVAGAQAVYGGDAHLAYGMSEVKGLAAVHLLNGNADAGGEFTSAALSAMTSTGYLGGAAGLSTYTQADSGVGTVASGATSTIDDERMYGDGDLKIHFGFTDAWEKGGGFDQFLIGNGSNADGTTTGLSLSSVSWADAVEVATQAVDFEFSIDAIGIAGSTYAVGSSGQDLTVNGASGQINGTNHATGTDTDGTTTLISGLSVRGYLGPEDLHIENNGNGFGADGSDNAALFAASKGTIRSGNADSKIHWDSYFNITDLDVYIDIAGVQLSDIKIANTRGDVTGLDGNASFGFAHSKRDIYAVKDTVLNIASAAGINGGANISGYVDGVAINTEFKGDIDIGALSFGDTGTSIGAIYLTDVQSTTNWTISAH